MRYLPEEETMRSGQAVLVMVLVVMLVGLGVGVSASKRAVSNVRRAVYTQQSDQAYNCAESGAESGIALVSSDTPPDPPETGNPHTGTLTNDAGTVNVCSYSYNVSNAVETWNGNDLYSMDAPIPQDDVLELNLEGFTGQLVVFWGTSNNSSIEVTLIRGASAPYTVEKRAFYCDTLQTGFEAGVNNPSPKPAFTKCSTGDIDVGASARLARVRPLFADAHIYGWFRNDSAPTQGYKIVSTGTSGETQRTLQVKVTRPHLPNIFDYVLFSGADITK